MSTLYLYNNVCKIYIYIQYGILYLIKYIQSISIEVFNIEHPIP